MRDKTPIGYQIFDSLDRPMSNLEPTASCLWAELGKLWDGRQDDRDVTFAIAKVYDNGDVEF
jgi:hypothetical protein